VRTDRYGHRLALARAATLPRLAGVCQTAATAPASWATQRIYASHKSIMVASESCYFLI